MRTEHERPPAGPPRWAWIVVSVGCAIAAAAGAVLLAGWAAVALVAVAAAAAVYAGAKGSERRWR